MKDQLEHWNNAHAQHRLAAYSQQRTEFAQEVNAKLHKYSKILELGCGEGNDSVFFASQGHTVIATDFSDVVIAENNQRPRHRLLQFKIQDLSQPFIFADDEFDTVYARLSLHYFTDTVTSRIFHEIARVLKPGGVLFFMCKEVTDPIYGKGEKIEDDMFELDGHVRHFFSEPYVNKLLDSAGLLLKSIETGHERIYDRQSAFIKVIATKFVVE